MDAIRVDTLNGRDWDGDVSPSPQMPFAHHQVADLVIDCRDQETVHFTDQPIMGVHFCAGVDR